MTTATDIKVHGYSVTRDIAQKDGSFEPYTFEFENVTPGIACTLADMLKFNAEHDSGLHKDRGGKYKPEDFARVRSLVESKAPKD